MHMINIRNAKKKMSVNEMRDFIFETILNELNFHKKPILIPRKF